MTSQRNDASSFQLHDRDKFVLLLVSNVFTEPRDLPEIQLSGNTWVLPKYPTALDMHWEALVGTIRFEEIKRANLVLSSVSPSRSYTLEREDESLGERMAHLYSLLQLSGVIEHEAANLLTGSLDSGNAYIRQMASITTYRPTKGYTRNAVTIERLQEAAQFLATLNALRDSSGHQRFLRGLGILFDGLRQQSGQERLHQFVRALEALTLPSTGATKRNFSHRCQTFASASAEAAAILNQAFDMRSDAEHVHEWDRSLGDVAPEKPEDVALWRTRQMERLACTAFSRALGDQNILRHFIDENSISSFWKFDDATRRRIWGVGLDLSSIPIVRSYDQWGRARG